MVSGVSVALCLGVVLVSSPAVGETARECPQKVQFPATGFTTPFMADKNDGIAGERAGKDRGGFAAGSRFNDLGNFGVEGKEHRIAGWHLGLLGFAIAIHVDADILLIDEILAVGDEKFHHKCIPQLKRMQREGTSMVIASHALNLFSELCDRVIWLDGGRVMMDGPPDEVIERYSPHTVVASE